jgi:hypothetical protein
VKWAVHDLDGALLSHALVDELHLLLYPLTLGSGAASTTGYDFPELAVVLVSHHIERAIRTAVRPAPAGLGPPAGAPRR